MIHIASTYVADVLNDYLKQIIQPFLEHYHSINQLLKSKVHIVDISSLALSKTIYRKKK